MGSIRIGEFRDAYRHAVEQVLSSSGSTGEDLTFAIPATGDLLNLRGYLSMCETVYVEALQLDRARRPPALPASGLIFDAGGSYGTLALALASLGARVATDEPRSAANASEGLATALEQAGVSIGSEVEPVDLVVCLSLLPGAAAERAAALVAGSARPHARLALAVPNARYWPRRLRQLLRRTQPEPAAGAAPLDRTPCTETQLRRRLQAEGFRLDSVVGRDVTPRGLGGPRQQLMFDLVLAGCPARREVLIAHASRAGGR